MISCGCASNRNTLCNDSANLPCSDPRNPTTRSFWTAPRCWAFLICSTAIDLQVSSARQATAMRSLVVPSTAPSVRPLSARPHTAPAVSQRGSRQVARANPLENVINSLTVALKNSPLNEGKKALAKAQAGQYDEAAVRSKINGLIADNAVMVFSWSGCPFCKNAKGLLSDLGAAYTAVELDTLGDEGKAIRAELAQMTDRTSVPNIWIKGQNVGGCNDGPGVMTLHKEGKLVPLLQAAGAL